MSEPRHRAVKRFGCWRVQRRNAHGEWSTVELCESHRHAYRRATYLAEEQRVGEVFTAVMSRIGPGPWRGGSDV